MLVFRIDCKVEVELMGLVVMDGIRPDESPALYIRALGIAGAINGVKLLRLVSVIEIVGNGVKHEKELVGEADVVANFIV